MCIAWQTTLLQLPDVIRRGPLLAPDTFLNNRLTIVFRRKRPLPKSRTGSFGGYATALVPTAAISTNCLFQCVTKFQAPIALTPDERFTNRESVWTLCSIVEADEGYGEAGVGGDIGGDFEGAGDIDEIRAVAGSSEGVVDLEFAKAARAHGETAADALIRSDQKVGRYPGRSALDNGRNAPSPALYGIRIHDASDPGFPEASRRQDAEEDSSCNETQSAGRRPLSDGSCSI